MKAVIVEIRGERAAALLEDGRFVSIPDNAYAVGQEITLLKKAPVKKKARPDFLRRAAAIAASAALILAAGSGGLAYATPYGTVSMDVNPSIEYTINRFDRVLGVSGLNEDGQAVLDSVGESTLLHKKIDAAVSLTISQLEADGYLTGEEDTIVFSSGTASEEHSSSLAASLEEEFSPQAEVFSVAVTRDEIASAHEKGTTAGKMKLIDRLEREAPELFDENDWTDRPVKDLMQAYREGPDSFAPSAPESFAPSSSDSSPSAVPASPDSPSEGQKPSSPEENNGEAQMREDVKPQDSKTGQAPESIPSGESSHSQENNQPPESRTDSPQGNDFPPSGSESSMHQPPEKHS